MSQEADTPLPFLVAALVEGHCEDPCVVIVRTREEFLCWLRDLKTGVEWLQVEGLLEDQEVWAAAAQGASALPLDVILLKPAAEFSLLYRLVDVRIVRNVRVTMPAAPGFMKALRLAASLQLPVRLLPGQPTAESLAELTAAAHFYIHDTMVESPVEPFHSLLVAFRGVGVGTIWTILEEDPAIFARAGLPQPRDFVEKHLAHLIKQGAECATCRWQSVCAGYFKLANPEYDCAGVKQLFALIESAAEEIGHDLASHESTAD